MHLSNLRSMSRLSPRTLKISEFGTPKSFDVYKSTKSNIRTLHDEDRKPNAEDLLALREGINKENAGPSPLNCINPFFVGSLVQSSTLFSSSCPSLLSVNYVPPSMPVAATPLLISATASPTLRSVSPSFKRRPRPLILHPLETSPPSQTLPRSPLIAPETRKAVPQRVSLCPTTARFMMLEAMVEEATSQTAEAYATSRKHSAPSSSSVRSRLPTFSACNPFGRAPKAIAPAPSSSSSFVAPSAPAEDTDYPPKESKFEHHKTGNITEKKIRDIKVRDNQETESSHDSITGLPDMQLVRDHNQSKDQIDSPYHNCQGVLEKVSVLLKLFQTHTDDVPSETEETSDLFVMPEMTTAYVSMSRRSNTPVDHLNQPETHTRDTLSPLTIICPDADGGIRGVSGVIAMTDDVYQGSQIAEPLLAVKTPLRSMKAPTFSPDITTKLAECSLNRSPRERSFSTVKDRFLSLEVRDCLTRTSSRDQISPKSDSSHTIYESGLTILSPLELPGFDMKLDSNSPTASGLSDSAYTFSDRPVTASESGRKLSVPIISPRHSRMIHTSRGRGDSFKTPPPVTKLDYSVSRSDVDRLRGLLCVPLITDRGSSDRNDVTVGDREGERGGSSICRSFSTNSPGSMSACRAAVSRVVAPSAARRNSSIGWESSRSSSGCTSDTDITDFAKSLILDGSGSHLTDLERVQKEGRMRRIMGSRDRSSSDVSPVSSTPRGQEDERDERERTGSNRTYSVGLNSAGYDCSSEIMRTYAIEAVMSNIETAEEAEKRASYRLEVRCQIAKWKYHWELASYQAAKVARLLSTESF